MTDNKELNEALKRIQDRINRCDLAADWLDSAMEDLPTNALGQRYKPETEKAIADSQAADRRDFDYLIAELRSSLSTIRAQEEEIAAYKAKARHDDLEGDKLAASLAAERAKVAALEEDLGRAREAESMVLYCPAGHQHIDEGEWATKPHKTHRCTFGPMYPDCGCYHRDRCEHKCGLEWRPVNFPTVGVAALDREEKPK
jgi:predicted RNase H-like nuclease (RuvC/YqgF family)